jgi:hypothetical protein
MVISICLGCRHIERISNALEVITTDYGVEQTYADPKHDMLLTSSTISQAKKRFEGGNVTDHWVGHLDFDEVRARIMAANGTELTVLANDTSVSTSDLLVGMPNNLGQIWDTDDMFETEDDISNYRSSVKSVVDKPKKRPEAMFQPVLRKTSDPRITPLLKRASPKTLEQARKIVKDAIAESFKLNKARLATPRVTHTH